MLLQIVKSTVGISCKIYIILVDHAIRQQEYFYTLFLDLLSPQRIISRIPVSDKKQVPRIILSRYLFIGKCIISLINTYVYECRICVFERLRLIRLYFNPRSMLSSVPLKGVEPSDPGT